MKSFRITQETIFNTFRFSIKKANGRFKEESIDLDAPTYLLNLRLLCVLCFLTKTDNSIEFFLHVLEVSHPTAMFI